MITAPKQVRITRVLKRDDTNEEEIKSRMDNQWPDEKKKELADFIIENEQLSATRKQVQKIHEYLIETVR